MDDADIWRTAHEIAAAEIKRISSGSWGGGHEPNPGLAAAIANHAIAVRDAEREACAKIVLDGSFLHDQAPTAVWAREVASLIRNRT